MKVLLTGLMMAILLFTGCKESEEKRKAREKQELKKKMRKKLQALNCVMKKCNSESLEECRKSAVISKQVRAMLDRGRKALDGGDLGGFRALQGRIKSMQAQHREQTLKCKKQIEACANKCRK